MIAQAEEVGITDDEVEEEAEVLDAFLTGRNVVLGRDGGEVNDAGPEAGEDGGGHGNGDGRDGTPCLTDLEDDGHVV